MQFAISLKETGFCVCYPPCLMGPGFQLATAVAMKWGAPSKLGAGWGQRGCAVCPFSGSWFHFLDANCHDTYFVIETVHEIHDVRRPGLITCASIDMALLQKQYN